MTEPNPLSDALAKAVAGMKHAGDILTTQAAIAWVYKGDLVKAREVLAKLPADKLVEVSMAAAALSSLADEVAAEKRP